MPGVTITTVTRSGPVGVPTAPSGQFFVVGQAERGPTTGVRLVRSILEFEAIYGSRVAYSHLYDNVATFFEEGGDQAYIARTVGPGATIGTLTLQDRQTPGESTIKLDAASPGAWSANIGAVVTNASGGGATVAITLSGVTVETFTSTTAAGLAEALADSVYVVPTNMGSDASTEADKLPKVGTFTLSAGADDRASITATQYEASLALFDISLGDGSVAIPGLGTAVHAILIAHARANRRIALLSESETASTATLLTTADNLNSEYAGLFAPWVQISAATGNRYTSPEGYVAASRNRAHVQVGPWRAAAGQLSIARSVIGLKYDYTRTQGDALDAGKVNAIRTVGGSIRVYGWRSLSDDTANYAMLYARDVLNRIVTVAEQRLEQYVFEVVDGKGALLSQIHGTLVGIVEPMATAGGLFARVNQVTGEQMDPGYLVETGGTVNTLDNLANNEVRGRVSVRVSPTAALISVTIVKVGLLGLL